VFVYVRKYVPPETSGLSQQLSTHSPQSVVPSPATPQLGAVFPDGTPHEEPPSLPPRVDE
jgi:hypothetical protein